jgi:hypothetical protein
MSSRTPANRPPGPVPTGLRVIETLSLVILALMAFLLAAK